MGDDKDDKDYVNFVFDARETFDANWKPDPEEGMTDEEIVWHRLKHGPPKPYDLDQEISEVLADEIRKEIDKSILDAITNYDDKKTD